MGESLLGHLCLLLMAASWSSASNLPLLSGTLKTFQVHACDGEDLLIECHPNTVISINLVQYGRKVGSHQLCPHQQPPTANSLGTTEAALNESTNCIASEAHRTVEAACREQRICKVKTSPESFGGDPCPGTRKYAEVAYKCRPNTFFNKIVCEGDRLRLRCPRSSRIVIYSAAFGGTHYEVPECAQPPGVKGHDCQSSYSTETVMSTCHSRRKCSVGVDLGAFGNPGCSKGVRLYLKVVYTCVPKEILKDLELGGVLSPNGNNGDSGDETKELTDEGGDYQTLTSNVGEERSSAPTIIGGSRVMAQPPKQSSPYEPTTVRGGKVISEGEHKKVISEGVSPISYPAKGDGAAGGAYPTVSDRFGPRGGGLGGSATQDNDLKKVASKSDMQSDENLDGEAAESNCTQEQRVIGFLTEWVNAFNYVKTNKEKFILYLTLSLSLSLIAFLLVLAGRQYSQRQKERHQMTKIRISEPLASNAYGGDDLGDLDMALGPSDHLTSSGMTSIPVSLGGGGVTTLGSVSCGVGADQDVVRFTNSRSTMRRQDSDTHPRAPVARNMNNYYYS